MDEDAMGMSLEDVALLAASLIGSLLLRERGKVFFLTGLNASRKTPAAGMLVPVVGARYSRVPRNRSGRDAQVTKKLL